VAFPSSYVAIRQSIFRLPCEQLSLASYVFNRNNYIHLASFNKLNSPKSRVLSIFHNISGQTLRFNQSDSKSDAYLACISPRRAVPVASYLVRYKIQHASCFSPCGLLNLVSRLGLSPVTLTIPYRSSAQTVELIMDYPLFFLVQSFLGRII